jgi:hypothetical protein
MDELTTASKPSGEKEDRALLMLSAWLDGHLTDAEYEREQLLYYATRAILEGGLKDMEPWLKKTLIAAFKGQPLRRRSDGRLVPV